MDKDSIKLIAIPALILFIYVLYKYGRREVRVSVKPSESTDPANYRPVKRYKSNQTYQDLKRYLLMFLDALRYIINGRLLSERNHLYWPNIEDDTELESLYNSFISKCSIRVDFYGNSMGDTYMSMYEFKKGAVFTELKNDEMSHRVEFNDGYIRFSSLNKYSFADGMLGIILVSNYLSGVDIYYPLMIFMFSVWVYMKIYGLVDFHNKKREFAMNFNYNLKLFLQKTGRL